MTTNFYVPPDEMRGDRIVLPDDEARHARSVLRVEAGDEIVVVDGEGGWYRTRIDHVAPRQVVGHVIETRREVGEPDTVVTVGMGLLSKRSRFETFVEKAVEIGVRRIVPLRTRHTEVESVRADRLRRVMVAALKQCRRSRLPELAPPQSLSTLLDETTADVRLLCHGTDEGTPVATAVAPAPAERVLLLVGPEGGFAPTEVDAATDAGCTPVSLGARRLRAETAGIVAATAALLPGERRR
jgi:16S rRNA (uracil1498-N3)-methyltransferase